MRRSLLALVLLLQACDPPAPPAKDRGGFLRAPIQPKAGILRVARTSASAPEILATWKPTPGLPSFAFRKDYVGPKTRLETSSEVWHQGEGRGGSADLETIQLPVSDDGAFGFSEGKNGQEISVIMAQEGVRSEPSYRTTVGGSSQVFKIPSLRGRVIRTYEPSWPLEIPDGKDAVLWAVFVDEPADVPVGASLEERAKRATAAFLFRMRTADEKK